MLPDFVLRILLLVLGYLYPAFECFKIVESNRGDNEQLRFWCQYWIIVAILTAFERIGDIFVSWLPLYSELKLSFVIYLWNSNTQGTTYVYETLLKPFVRGHETEIDQRFSELAARSGDLIKNYVQNAADKGQSMFLEIMQFIMVPSSRKTKSNQKVDPLKRAEAVFGPDPIFPGGGDQARRTDDGRSRLRRSSK
ncbi:HVA22-like protein j [Acorus calamus]|uniref:HVA22-like protein n=1 Tax=Acorus calamus TaxID=4465 RepID=A0AAV9E9U9_ACOCL|nr:HVA22-like protein j [Acorus calamus]